MCETAGCLAFLFTRSLCLGTAQAGVKTPEWYLYFIQPRHRIYSAPPAIPRLTVTTETIEPATVGILRRPVAVRLAGM